VSSFDDDDDDDVIEDDATLPRCPCCRAVVIEPIALPCGDTLCMQCVDTLLSPDGFALASSVVCPYCRRKTPARMLQPTPGARYPINIAMRDLLRQRIGEQRYDARRANSEQLVALVRHHRRQKLLAALVACNNGLGAAFADFSACPPIDRQPLGAVVACTLDALCAGDVECTAMWYLPNDADAHARRRDALQRMTKATDAAGSLYYAPENFERVVHYHVRRQRNIDGSSGVDGSATYRLLLDGVRRAVRRRMARPQCYRTTAADAAATLERLQAAFPDLVQLAPKETAASSSASSSGAAAAASSGGALAKKLFPMPHLLTPPRETHCAHCTGRMPVMTPLGPRDFCACMQQCARGVATQCRYAAAVDTRITENICAVAPKGGASGAGAKAALLSIVAAESECGPYDWSPCGYAPPNVAQYASLAPAAAASNDVGEDDGSVSDDDDNDDSSVSDDDYSYQSDEESASTASSAAESSSSSDDDDDDDIESSSNDSDDDDIHRNQRQRQRARYVLRPLRIDDGDSQ
jgi:hypothetical protein